MMMMMKRTEMKSGAGSERDSGFSDAGSEHLSTDDASSGRTASSGGALPQLQPMIIMNNVVVKQSGESGASVKRWGLSPGLLQQPQVVFLQPLVPRPPPPKSSSRRRRHKRLLPALRSYPRIAPHPADHSPAPAAKSSSPPRPLKVQRHGTPPPDAAQDPAPPTGQSSPEPPPDTDTTKLKRFCNTYNVLRQSGLLDITLRTKELQRQNRRTHAQLQRLRLHTDMLLEACQSGDARVCAQLQNSLLEEEQETDHTLQSLL